MSLFKKKAFQYGVVAMVALAVVTLAVLLDRRYRDARIAETARQFQLLTQLRKSALGTYFNTARAEIGFWSVTDTITDTMQDMSVGWQALDKEGGAGLEVRRLYVDNTSAGVATDVGALTDAGDGSVYSEAHAKFDRLASEFVSERGYYDLFLIDLDGNVIYSVEKELDFGTNLLNGPYKDSGLARMFETIVATQAEGGAAAKGVHGSDFSRYAPSNNEPAIFGGQMMFDVDGKSIGIFALQLPSDTIIKIMSFTGGMGESGETFAVGDDLLMRSDSRFSDDSTILVQTVDTKTVRLALAGESGVAFTQDYRGVPVLSAYDYFDFRYTRWAIMAEIDAAEVRRDAGSIGIELAGFGAALFALLLFSFAAIRDLLSLDGGGVSIPDYDLDGG